MKTREFELLVEKFFEGNTSEAEELMLKEYIEKHDLRDDYKNLKAYFQIISPSDPMLGDDFDVQILEKLDITEKSKIVKSAWIYGVSGIAATALVFLALWFGTDVFHSRQVYGTITDPELALKITQEALQQVSFKINTGLNPTGKTIQKVDKSLKDVSQIKKIDQALDDARKMQEIEKAGQLLKSMNKVYIHVGSS